MSTPTTPPPPPPFILTRATDADMPAIIALMYHNFPAKVRALLMGCPNGEPDLPRATAHFRADLRRPHVAWLKVVDAATGRIAAAAEWRVYLGDADDDDAAAAMPMPWLEGDTRREATQLLRAMAEARRRANPGGKYLYLHILFTAREFRRRGAGGMLMAWGTELADALALPAWIEASPEGALLYRAHGFVDVATPDVFPGAFMARQPRVLRREGGRAG